MSTVAGLIAGTFIASGVQRVYGIAEGSLNGFTDALRTRPELAWVHVRHEEAAAFAAAVEATSPVSSRSVPAAAGDVPLLENPAGSTRPS